MMHERRLEELEEPLAKEKMRKWPSVSGRIMITVRNA